MAKVKALTVTQAAALYGCKRQYIYECIYKKKLDAEKVYNTWLIPLTKKNKTFLKINEEK